MENFYGNYSIPTENIGNITVPRVCIILQFCDYNFKHFYPCVYHIHTQS